MEIRFLGRTGLSVSELCLGAMTFGREATEAESHAMLDRFVAAGGNFIDTADVYSRGVSEEILARWLAGQSRDDLVIATKVRCGTDDPDGAPPEPLWARPKAHHAAVRGEPEAAQDRLHRSLPGPYVGSLGAARGDARARSTRS